MLRDFQASQPAGADSWWTTAATFGTPRNDGAAAARAAAGLWAQNLLMCSSVRSQVRSSRAHWTSGKRLEQEADVCERCEESAVVCVPHSGNRSGDPRR
jgi:hypothetical protein